MSKRSGGSGLAVGTLALLMVVASAAPSGAAGTRLNESRYGFTLTLPPGWVAPPLSGKALTTYLNRAKQLDPKLAPSIKSEIQQARDGEVKLLAFGPYSSTAPVNTNINVISGNQTLPLAQLKETALEELSQFDHVTVTTSTFPQLGTVVDAHYDAVVKGGKTVYGHQAYITHQGSTYVVTLTSASKSVSPLNYVLTTWRWS
jgi:hypothetical protein